MMQWNFDTIMKNNINIAKRFLFRAYEIAKYQYLFNAQINWDQINTNILSQVLYIYFKNMITMINYIFPEIFPKTFLHAVYSKEYVL